MPPSQVPPGEYPSAQYPPEPLQYAGAPASQLEWEPQSEDAHGGGSSANASADNAGGFFGEQGEGATDDQDESNDDLVPSPDDFELVADDFEPNEEEADKDELAPEDEEVPTLAALVGPNVDLDQQGAYDQDANVEADTEPQPESQPDSMRQSTPRMQPQPKKGNGGPAGLLDYLASMTAALPPDKKQAFENSDAHLKLEYLRARLAGRAGLHRDGGKYIRVPKDQDGSPITAGRLRDTLQYIGQITRYHPDPAIANVLEARMSRVVKHLERERG